MSARTVADAICDQLATVGGVSAIILGDPTGIHDPPTITVALSTMGRQPANQVIAVLYTFLARVIVRWQENDQAEAELLDLAHAIPLAIEADRTLGGVLTSGIATVGQATAGYVSVSGVLYRMLEFPISVTEKGPFGGTL